MLDFVSKAAIVFLEWHVLIQARKCFFEKPDFYMITITYRRLYHFCDILNYVIYDIEYLDST